MADFFKSLLFSGKTAFLKLSADFLNGFHPKALQTRMQININNFFYSSSGSGDIREKLKLQNQLDVVTHCMSNVVKCNKTIPGHINPFMATQGHTRQTWQFNSIM